MFRSGSEIRSIPITEGLSFTLADAEFGATHTFAVSAVSSVGTSALSPQSKPAQLKGVPGVIQSLRTAPTSAPNELTLTFDPPETNGHVLVGYWYYTRDVGQAILAPTDSHRLGLGDRTIVVDYIGVSDTIVTLGACYAEDIEVDAGQREMTTPPGCDGRVVESNRQSPLWPPAMPTLDVSQEDEQVVFTLSGNDNGSPITSYQYAVDDMFGVRHEVPDGNQLRLRRGDGTIHEIFFFAVNAIGGSLPTGLTHAHVDVAWPQ